MNPVAVAVEAIFRRLIKPKANPEPPRCNSAAFVVDGENELRCILDEGHPGNVHVYTAKGHIFSTSPFGDA